MASIASGVSYNVVTGTPTLIPGAPFGSPNQVPAAVLFNNSSYVLQVSVPGGGPSALLQPLSADVFSFPGIALGLTVLPINVAATFNTYTFLGTVTAVFYSSIEAVTGSYPLPLTAFPGGAQLLVTPPAPLSQYAGTVYPGYFEIDSPATGTNPPSLFISPPPGATELIFTNLQINLGNVGAAFQIIGLQTGKEYANITASANNTAPYIVSLVGSQDSTYSIGFFDTVSSSQAAWSNLFAAQGSAVGPSGLLYSSGSIANGSQILAPFNAPDDAIWITGFDALAITGPDSIALGNVAAQLFGAVYCPVISEWYGKEFSSPIRVTSAVYIFNRNVNQSNGLILRGYYGP